MNKLTRRKALAMMGMGGLVAGTGGFWFLPGQNPTARPPEKRPTLPKPKSAVASDPVVPMKVTHASGTYGYNGQSPGPVRRIRAGESFSTSIINRLDEETTVHWHGLVVPTEVDGQPLDAIAPQQCKDVTFTVKQRASLNWYHPHPHGSTARQAWGGLAGLFIVEDDEEAALNLPSGDRELLLSLRDGTSDGQGQPTYIENIAGTEGDFPVVNGVAWPRTVLPAAFIRLRILNAANARVFRLTTEAPLLVIGNDGGLIDSPRAVSEIEMSPAERIDALLDLRGFRPGDVLGLDCADARWRMLEIEVAHAPPDDFILPSRLCSIELLRHSGRVDRTFVFQQDQMINGLVHDMSRIDFAVRLGAVERWRFMSAQGAPHPVHVHGAHFQVQSREGGFQRGVKAWESGWKDTVLVGTHETVDVLIRFDAHEGRYLLHCHKLEHEDQGMMLNFLVSKDPEDAMQRAELERLWGPICTTS